MTEAQPPPSPWRRPTVLAVAIAAAAIGLVAFEAKRTAPVRDAVRAYTALITAANRGDLDAVRSVCSERYLAGHPVRAADKGGVIGLPRGIHKNFRAWPEGEHIWICPTNRIGPVFQFVRTPDGWKFDGPVGQLRPGNVFEPADEASGF